MSLALTFREASESDAEVIAQIESLSFKTPWTKDMVLSEIREPISHFYLAVTEDGVAGYYGFLHILDELHILNVAVDPSFRRQGVGGAMMSHLKEEMKRLSCRAATLEVRESNSEAIKLYERAGFSLAGVRPHYYMDKENALIYWLEQ